MKFNVCLIAIVLCIVITVDAKVPILEIEVSACSPENLTKADEITRTLCLHLSKLSTESSDGKYRAYDYRVDAKVPMTEIPVSACSPENLVNADEITRTLCLHLSKVGAESSDGKYYAYDYRESSE